ncbi:hypothetical protein CL618_00675 [archaeon]|nr:hypothetical protein [archaeon]|tara:strand:+ start:971 stop:1321 length:351 start_codon:yes stop_codon:yes gene_type:complete
MENGLILIVEDSKWVETFKEFLKLDDSNYSIEWYTQGKEAVDAIRENLIYDLLLTDLGECSGDEVIKESRRTNPRTPIISISGYETKPTGSNLHLTKPISYHEIKRHIEELISSKP